MCTPDLAKWSVSFEKHQTLFVDRGTIDVQILDERTLHQWGEIDHAGLIGDDDCLKHFAVRHGGEIVDRSFPDEKLLKVHVSKTSH